MSTLVKILRATADPTRLRILLLLESEELSVAELQEVLVMGQSTISTHLGQLKQAGLVEDRRIGKYSLYRLSDAGRTGVLPGLLAEARGQVDKAALDAELVQRVLRKRQDRMRSFFDEVAGRPGQNYAPGKSWKAVAEALLRLMPPLVIADLGAGEGAFSLLLAQRATKVIAVDNSPRMVEVGQERARKANAANVEFRLGDMEALPIEDQSVDLVFFQQSLHHALHPQRALAEARRILRVGGRVAILDLAKHRFEEARELYADEWLGFSDADMGAMLWLTGFADKQISVVHRESDPPHFQTLLAIATRGEKARDV